MICLDESKEKDEMGPQSAKSVAGQQPVRAAPAPDTPAERARQEIDYGRRGSGYVFGAFRPATGEAFTRPYGGRTIANWVDFLAQADRWLPADAERVYAILDKRSWTTSRRTGRRTCCCSRWHTRAGSSCSSRCTRRT